mmetsp:Transcript_15219/g.28638  ORF Transcript_15219/g.28638 Transcript_15219/m.28638 type:complete len:90 (-) Transcript_15219:1062-1331(-)
MSQKLKPGRQRVPSSLDSSKKHTQGHVTCRVDGSVIKQGQTKGTESISGGTKKNPQGSFYGSPAIDNLMDAFDDDTGEQDHVHKELGRR